MRKWIVVALISLVASCGIATFAESVDALNQATVTVVDR